MVYRKKEETTGRKGPRQTNCWKKVSVYSLPWKEVQHANMIAFIRCSLLLLFLPNNTIRNFHVALDLVQLVILQTPGHLTWFDSPLHTLPASIALFLGDIRPTTFRKIQLVTSGWVPRHFRRWLLAPWQAKRVYLKISVLVATSYLGLKLVVTQNRIYFLNWAN